jgi:Cys-rich protein (TIGR01571 family)
MFQNPSGFGVFFLVVVLKSAAASVLVRESRALRAFSGATRAVNLGNRGRNATNTSGNKTTIDGLTDSSFAPNNAVKTPLHAVPEGDGVLSNTSATNGSVVVTHIRSEHLTGRTHSGTKHNTSEMVLPVDLAIIASKCQCRFIGYCTCGAAIEFMDCVADACASGVCDCKVTNFMHSCDSMSTTCPSVGLHCSQEKATCLHTPEPVSMTVPEIREKLARLKKRKCKLEKAIDAGYFNAHKRLQELLPEIQSYLDILKLKGDANAVYMDCGSAPAGIRGTNWTASRVGGKAVSLEKEATAPVKAPRADVWKYWWNGTWIMGVNSSIATIAVLFIVAFLYDRVRLKTLFVQHKPHECGNDGFQYGLFGCHNDLRTTVFTCCCPALRWADTLDKAKPNTTPIIRYWVGIAVQAGLIFLTCLLFPFLIMWAPIWIAVNVYFRQQLRMRYDITSRTCQTFAEDIFAWTCCACCANVQEARQVEAGRHISPA